MYFKLKLEMKSFLYYIYRLCNFIAVKKLTCYKMYRSNNSSFKNDDYIIFLQWMKIDFVALLYFENKRTMHKTV